MVVSTPNELLNNQKASIGFVDDLADYFNQSEFFGDRASLIELEYQFISNRLSREDITKQIIPSLGFAFEKRIIHNFGLRLSLSSHWWLEDNVLASSPTRDYDQEINYLYSNISLSTIWHVPINEKFDPYLGFAYSYRNVLVSCICFREFSHSHDLDLLFGMRYLLAGQFYTKFEIGHTGTSYIKLGVGFRLGYK